MVISTVNIFSEIYEASDVDKNILKRALIVVLKCVVNNPDVHI